jgi:hypothetical protein
LRLRRAGEGLRFGVQRDCRNVRLARPVELVQRRAGDDRKHRNRADRVGDERDARSAASMIRIVVGDLGR